VEGEEERKRGMVMLGGESGFDDGEMEEEVECRVRGRLCGIFQKLRNDRLIELFECSKSFRLRNVERIL